MNKQDKLLKELLSFSQQYFSDRDYFACVYGSCASGEFSDKSDIDMFVATEDYNSEDFQKVLDFFLDLHQRYDIELDNEVPYQNKLLVTYNDVKKAVSLEAFQKRGDDYFVPSVVKSDDFLSSPQIKWRLIFNGLTSPHIFIAGNSNVYKDYKKQAEESLFSLAKNLTRKKNPSTDDIVRALFVGENGECGEWYLGYKEDKKKVKEHLKNIILCCNSSK